MHLNYIDNYKSIIEIINEHKNVNNRDIDFNIKPFINILAFVILLTLAIKICTDGLA